MDALAPRAEEGRGKLRKVMGSRKQALIHEYPNGGTQQWYCTVTHAFEREEGTRGTETSKYPEEK